MPKKLRQKMESIYGAGSLERVSWVSVVSHTSPELTKTRLTPSNMNARRGAERFSVGQSCFLFHLSLTPPLTVFTAFPTFWLSPKFRPDFPVLHFPFSIRLPYVFGPLKSVLHFPTDCSFWSSFSGAAFSLYPLYVTVAHFRRFPLILLFR